MAKKAKIYKSDTRYVLIDISIPEEVLSEAAIRGSVLRSLQLIGKDMQKDFEKTVTHWNEPAEFTTTVRYAGGNPRVRVDTDSAKWKWLNFGTQERWAIMDKRFKPKTTVGRFVSGRGSPNYQEPTWRGYSMGIPQPGIEARDWTGLADRKYRKVLRREMRKALRKSIGK